MSRLNLPPGGIIGDIAQISSREQAGLGGGLGMLDIPGGKFSTPEPGASFWIEIIARNPANLGGDVGQAAYSWQFASRNRLDIVTMTEKHGSITRLQAFEMNNNSAVPPGSIVRAWPGVTGATPGLEFEYCCHGESSTGCTTSTIPFPCPECLKMTVRERAPGALNQPIREIFFEPFSFAGGQHCIWKSVRWSDISGFQITWIASVQQGIGWEFMDFAGNLQRCVECGEWSGSGVPTWHGPFGGCGTINYPSPGGFYIYYDILDIQPVACGGGVDPPPIKSGAMMPAAPEAILPAPADECTGCGGLVKTGGMCDCGGTSRGTAPIIGPIEKFDLSGSDTLNQAASYAIDIWTVVDKTADEARATTTTLANDGKLLFTMLANTNYRIHLFVWFDCGDAAGGDGFKYALTGPASPTRVRVKRQHMVPGNVAGAENTQTDTAYTTSQSITPTAQNGGWVEMDIIVHNGANGGTFAFQWAQNSSDTDATTVRAGSSLKYKRIS